MNAKTLVQGFAVSLSGIVLALVAVWMVVSPTGWQPIVDGNFIWKVGTIVVVIAGVTAYLAAVLFVRCYEYGRTDARTEEVPVAYERGKEVGAEETMESFGEMLQFDEIPDGNYRVFTAVSYGDGYYLVAMRPLAGGTGSDDRLVQVPASIVDDFKISPGYIYSFRRSKHEQAGWQVEQVGK
jgi:hypothetical protein